MNRQTALALLGVVLLLGGGQAYLIYKIEHQAAPAPGPGPAELPIRKLAANYYAGIPAAWRATEDKIRKGQLKSPAEIEKDLHDGYAALMAPLGKSLKRQLAAFQGENGDVDDANGAADLLEQAAAGMK